MHCKETGRQGDRKTRRLRQMKRGKLIIISAPSGTGKSTIIGWLMREHPELNLAFSISCTSRAPRGTEQNGVEYFFLTPEEFRQRIDNDEFLEYEEVYEGRFYGTLKAQVERQLEAGQNVVFDVDVKGGVNIKKYYGDEALSIFIQPPSIAELRRRLEGRGTDAPEVIDQRIARAEFEMTFVDKFDKTVINDDLAQAEQDALELVKDDDTLRMEMARLALDGVDGIIASDYEMHLSKPSYTWNTLQALSKDYPDREFVLLMGGDNWEHFDRWYHYEDIKRCYEVAVYTRTPGETGYIDISSTDIRQRIKAGKGIRRLVPKAVADYIKEKGLYKGEKVKR